MFPHLKNIAFLAIASILLLAQSRAEKIYERCELARELLDVHELPKDQIGTWVCIARHESEYNTSAINKGSGDHGLFQISELFWCSPPGAACGVSCDSLKDDDIEDDVVCARRIYRQHQRLHGNGFLAWVVYNQHCRNAQDFVKDCWTKDVDNSLTKKDPSVATTDVKDSKHKNTEKIIDLVDVDAEDEVVKVDADECNFANADGKSLKKNCKKPKIGEEIKGKTVRLSENYEYASTRNGFKLVYMKKGQK